MLPVKLSALAEVDASGAFVRSASKFTHRIGSEQFPAVAGRYILYVSLACPWACRTLALRALKGLEHVVPVAIVAPRWALTKPQLDDHLGWVFRSCAHSGDMDLSEVPLTDPVFQANSIRAVYEAAAPDVQHVKFTVPLLLDTVTRQIVCNESELIMRDFNSAFDSLARFPAVDLRPPHLSDEIDKLNEAMYGSINDGVYRCGFAQSQAAYDEAVCTLSASLDAFDLLLSRQRFLVPGGVLTEADIRLWVTLVRYDAVYVVYFKTNARILRVDCPNLVAFCIDVAAAVGGDGGCSVREAALNLLHIKRHYFGSHPSLNALGIIPTGPPGESSQFSGPVPSVRATLA